MRQKWQPEDDQGCKEERDDLKGNDWVEQLAEFSEASYGAQV